MKISEINVIAKTLGLYEKIDYVGKGFDIFLPRGAKMIEIIQKYIENKKESLGYEIVKTPCVSNPDIYRIEDRFKGNEDEFFAIREEYDENDENNLVLKPYVAPFHCSIFRSTQHSYKELPIKFIETSTIVKNERDIKGSIKTRQFSASTSSIFTNKENIQKSIKEEVKFLVEYIKKLGIDISIRIDNWNDCEKENYIGTIAEWDSTVSAMKNVLDDLNIKYKITKEAPIYGPRISFVCNQYLISDIQIDFEITHRFDLKYKNSNDKDEFPYYINTSIVKSYEDLIKILIETYKGEFPLWIAPFQAVIIPEGEEFEDYAQEIFENLKTSIRCKIDNYKTSSKNRFDKNVVLKVPYIITIGKKELNNEKIRVFKYKKMLEENRFENDNSLSEVMTENELIKEVGECQTKY